MRRRNGRDIGVAVRTACGVERFDLERARRKFALRRRCAIAKVGEHHRDFVVTVENSGAVVGQRLGSVGQRVTAIGQDFIDLERNRRQMSVMQREHLEMALRAAEKLRHRGALEHDRSPNGRGGIGEGRRGDTGRGSHRESERHGIARTRRAHRESRAVP